jgi:hypothetical protein
MELVLGHFRADRRQVQDLVAQWLRVLALKGMAAPPTMRGLEDFRVVGREEGPLLPRVPRLAAGPAARGWARRAALDCGRVGGGRARRVGGVLVELAAQVQDLLL